MDCDSRRAVVGVADLKTGTDIVVAEDWCRERRELEDCPHPGTKAVHVNAARDGPNVERLNGLLDEVEDSRMRHQGVPVGDHRDSLTGVLSDDRLASRDDCLPVMALVEYGLKRDAKVGRVAVDHVGIEMTVQVDWLSSRHDSS
jgi:hypothetical protein